MRLVISNVCCIKWPRGGSGEKKIVIKYKFIVFKMTTHKKINKIITKGAKILGKTQ